MKVKEPSAWVVYRMGLVGKQPGQNAVCTQPEWVAMELARPGQHTLIQANIINEGEAERLARNLQTPIDQPKARRTSYSAFRKSAIAPEQSSPILPIIAQSTPIL